MDEADLDFQSNACPILPKTFSVISKFLQNSLDGIDEKFEICLFDLILYPINKVSKFDIGESLTQGKATFKVSTYGVPTNGCPR